jgi:hypothetical protein
MPLPWRFTRQTKTSRRRPVRPRLEVLEGRLVPSASWVFQGPTAIQNAQVLLPGVQNYPVIGAVNAILPDPADATGNTLYVTTTNGGVWKTTDAYDTTPVWTSLNADLPDLAVSDLRFDPSDSGHKTLYAGTGNYSNGEIPGAPSFNGPEGPAGVGVLKSTDGGAHWAVLGGTGNALAGKDVRVVLPTLQTAANSTTAKSVLLAGTYEPDNPSGLSSSTQADGLWRSTDDGKRWTRVSGNTSLSGGGQTNQLPDAPVNDLVADPTDPSGLTYYLATNGAGDAATAGVYVSTDGGLVWAPLNTGLAFTSPPLNGSGPDAPYTPGNLRLGINAARTDPGTQQLLPPVLYVGITDQYGSGGNYSGDLQAVWRLDLDVPQGTTPTWVSMGLPVYQYKDAKGKTANASVNSGDHQGLLNFTLLADNVNPDVVYVGGDTLANVSNGPDLGYNDYYGVHAFGTYGASQTWTFYQASNTNGTTGSTQGTAPHSDSRDMQFDAQGNILESDDGGLYRLEGPRGPQSSPATQSQWVAVIGNADATQGIANTEVYSAAYDPYNNVVFGGAQDTGSFRQSAPGSGQFTELLAADGGQVASEIDPLTGYSFQYVEGNDGSLARYVYTPGGAEVTSLTNSSLPLNGFSSDAFPFAVNALDPNQLLLATGNSIYSSNDGGTSASLDFSVSSSDIVNRLAFGGTSGGVANPGVAYAGTLNGYVYFRQYASSPWVKEKSYGGTEVWDLKIDPNDWQTAYVLDASGKLWQTQDSGAHFQDITGDLDQLDNPAGGTNFLSTLAVVPLSSATGGVALVAGGLGGVWACVNPGPSSQWSQVGTGLPGAMVSSVQYDPTANVLVGGTYGRGIWTLPDATATLSGLLSPTTTVLAGSPNPASPGQVVTLTATVRGPAGDATTPQGTVTFYDGPTALGTATLQAAGGVGQATFTTVPGAGSHSLMAVYASSNGFAASTSAAVDQVVAAPAPGPAPAPAVTTGALHFTATPQGPFFPLSGLLVQPLASDNAQAGPALDVPYPMDVFFRVLGVTRDAAGDVDVSLGFFLLGLDLHYGSSGRLTGITWTAV